MISLQEVKLKSRRSNGVQNDRLHFFASKFSIYFSWIFINLGLTANQVTGIFFVIGLLGSVCFLSQNIFLVFLGYFLWRLHIVFDLCDGDVARYTQKFSINGAYWDYMIHSILYPLYFVSILISSYFRTNEVVFLYMSGFGAVLVSQLLSVKNNYYRAMLFNSVKLNREAGANNNDDRFALLVNVLKNILGFEGFLFGYLALVLLSASSFVFIMFFIFYMAVFSFIALAKFYSFSRKGFYARRS